MKHTSYRLGFATTISTVDQELGRLCEESQAHISNCDLCYPAFGGLVDSSEELLGRCHDLLTAPGEVSAFERSALADDIKDLLDGVTR